MASPPQPSVTEGLLRVSNTWLRYVYPAVLLGVGILRRETIAGAVYVGAALVFSSCDRRWRVLSNVFSVTFFVFLMSACLLVFLCSFQVFEPWPAYLKVIGLGGVTSSTDCGSHWLMLPEALAAAASAASWVLLRRTRAWETDVEIVRQVRPELTKLSCGVLVGTLLVACASLSLNLFGLVYNTIAAAVLACLASAAPRQGLSPRASRGLRCALGTTTAVHVLTAIFLGFGGDGLIGRRPWPELLASPDDAGSGAQCACAFALLQVLLWCTTREREREEGQLLQLSPRERGEGQPPATSAAVPVSPPLEQGALSAAGAPLLPQGAPVPYEDAIGARSGSSGSQQSIGLSALASDVHPVPFTDSQPSVRAAPGPGLPQLLAAQLLSVASMLAWALVWPSMVTLLLLASGLALMTVPPRRISRAVLKSALLYEAAYSAVLYSYNVGCSGSACGAASLVPAQFLPRERLGLLSFASASLSPALAQAGAVLGQALCMGMLALALRLLGAPSGMGAEPPCLSRHAVLAAQWLTACGRPAAVVLVLMTALGFTSEGELSLLGLGYLVWLLCIVLCACALPRTSGWDALHGNIFWWRCLFCYSSLTAGLLFCWQVFAEENFPLVGLVRARNSFAAQLLQHVAASLLASLQIQARREKLKQPDTCLAASAGVPMQLLSDFGVFVQMLMVIMIVRAPPISMWSFFFLLLFVALVTVEQSAVLRSNVRLRILLATAIYCIVQLPVRYLGLLPGATKWLASVLPGGTYKVLDSLMALEGHDKESREEMAMVAALLVLSSYLLRGLRFYGADALEVGSGGSLERTHPLLARVLVEAARWSTLVVMVVAFSLLHADSDLLSRIQLVALLVLLILGRHWGRVGSLVSACSVASLLAQYAMRFDFVESRVGDQALAQWIGVTWDRTLALHEFLLAFMGIWQAAAQRATACCSLRPATLLTDAHRGDLGAHSAHVGAALLLLATALHNQVYSILNVAVVAAFVFTGVSSRRLSPKRASKWLAVMASVMALGLLYDLDCKNWDQLPQGLPQRPTSGQLADWWLCGAYSDVNATISGSVCNDGKVHADEYPALGVDEPAGGADQGGLCETQRARCGEAWESWICSEATPDGGSGCALQFALLVVVCMLRRACVVPSDPQRAAVGEGDESAAAPASAAVEGAGAGTLGSWAARAAGQLGGAAGTSLPGFLWGCSTCLLWLSMTALALFQSQTNFISLGYLILVILDVFASQPMRTSCHSGRLRFVAATQTQPMRRRMQVISFIRYFNLVIFAAATLFQSPLVPCPRALHLGDTGDCTSFTSPQQCFVLETCSSHGVGSDECKEVRKRVDWNAAGKSLSPDRQKALTEDCALLSVSFQVLGFQKRMSVADVDKFGLLNLLVFVFGTIQAVICSTYWSELQREIEAGGRVVEENAEEYVRHTHELRSLDVSKVDTKHRILRSKLKDLQSHLNELHKRRMGLPSESPEGRRAELPEGEQGDRERQRVLDLCLQSGLGEEEVEALLSEFEEAAEPRPRGGGDGAAVAPLDDAAAESVRSAVDECVLAQIRHGEDRKLRRITEAQEAEMKSGLLEQCRQALERRPGAPPADAREAEADATVPPPGGPAPGWAPATPSCWARLERCARLACEALIDDLLFSRREDETLASHRQRDGLPVLVGKAIWSQTLVMVFVGGVLQFASCRCLTSAVTISVLVCLLWHFPLAPAWLWQGLQLYNVGLVVLKVLYQLPTFTENVSTASADSYSSLTVMGLVKVNGGSNIHFSSMTEMLWADILVCILLFWHCYVLYHGGRMYYTPEDICGRLAALAAADGGDGGTASYAPEEGGGGASEQPIAAAGAPGGEDHEEGQAAAASETRAPAAGGLRKPAMDLYTYRFCLAMVCVFMILFFWNQLVAEWNSGQGNSFLDALQTNVFSGWQIAVLILLLGMLVADRMLYTRHMQRRWGRCGTEADRPGGESPPRPHSFSPGSPAPRTPASEGAAVSRSGSSAGAGRASHAANSFVLQVVLVVLQLVFAHVFCIIMWTQSSQLSSDALSMFSNTFLLLFYVLYISFLSLTSLQLRYDVYMVRGGLGLCHGQDMMSWLVFNVYCAIPFLEELRVLADWTVTSTSLNFFMWMKLEDAHQNLYRVRCDMNARRLLPPGHARLLREKILQGGLLLAGLFILIVGPALYFSTANVALFQRTYVQSATLKVFLEFQAPGDLTTRSLPLYETAQARIHDMSDTARSSLLQDWPQVTSWTNFSAQEVYFPRLSDTYWLVSKTLKDQTARRLSSSNETQVWISFYITLEANSTTSSRSLPLLDFRGNTKSVKLNVSQEDSITKMLESSNVSQTVSLECSMEGVAFMTLSGASLRDDSGSSTVSLNLAQEEDVPFPQWELREGSECQPTTITRRSNCEGLILEPTEGSGMCFNVISEWTPAGITGSSSGTSSSSSFSVMGIYIGVVYTIGRFLRMVFQDGSKRMIYEELRDTELLTDLCNGIYTARITGDLRQEHEFYYELVRIYRSPELLLEISGKWGSRGGIAGALLVPSTLASPAAPATPSPRGRGGTEPRFRGGRPAASRPE